MRHTGSVEMQCLTIWRPYCYVSKFIKRICSVDWEVKNMKKRQKKKIEKAETETESFFSL
jgi:hypothetical protein